MRWPALILCLGCSSPEPNPPLINPGVTGPGPSGGPAADGGIASEAGGTLTVLAAGLATPRAIAAASGFVYITVPSGVDDAGILGGILRVPEPGGALAALVTGIDSPLGLGLSSSTLCFSTAPAGGNGSVQCGPLLGGQGAVLVQQEAGLTSPVIDSGFAYWAHSQGGAVIERAPVGGGGATTVSMITGTFTPNGIAIDNGTLYLTVTQPGTVYKVPTTGGGPAEPLTDPLSVSLVDVVVDSANGRVLVGGPTEVLAFPTAGGAPTPLITNLPGDPAHLARDPGHLYWTSPADGQVYSLTLGQGTAQPVSLASGLSSPNAIAVDDAVYVTTLDGVVRLPRSL